MDSNNVTIYPSLAVKTSSSVPLQGQVCFYYNKSLLYTNTNEREMSELQNTISIKLVSLLQSKMLFLLQRELFVKSSFA